MKTIDARGKTCPLPLILTKKAITEAAPEETLEILVDNEISMKNVSRFLEDNGMKTNIESKGSVYHIYVNKTGDIPESSHVEDYCETGLTPQTGYAMVFKQNKVGHGADDLGAILMSAFINTLPEIALKPNWLIFLNTSIHLTLKDSSVLESLQKLEKKGVEILVCGTCLNYFGKKDELAVGKISNMYDILDCMSRAGKVIHP